MFVVEKTYQLPADIITKDVKGELHTFAMIHANEDSEIYNKYKNHRDMILSTDEDLEELLYSPYIYLMDEFVPRIINCHSVEVRYSFQVPHSDIKEIIPDFDFSEYETSDCDKDNIIFLGRKDPSEDGIINIDVLIPKSELLNIYMFEYGYGIENGFGGYSSPHWKDPIFIDDTAIAVGTKEEASYIVNALNNASIKEFYTSRGSSNNRYSNRFPMEYKATAFPVPKNNYDSFSFMDKDEVLSIVEDMHMKLWKG